MYFPYFTNGIIIHHWKNVKLAQAAGESADVRLAWKGCIIL